MLHVVGAARPVIPELRRLGLYGFEPELQGYVLWSLRKRWPRLAVTHAIQAEALQRVRPQLWLCAKPPPDATLAPILWLDGIGTDAVPTRFAPKLWRMAAPLTRARLVLGIERVLAT